MPTTTFIIVAKEISKLFNFKLISSDKVNYKEVPKTYYCRGIGKTEAKRRQVPERKAKGKLLTQWNSKGTNLMLLTKGPKRLSGKRSLSPEGM